MYAQTIIIGNLGRDPEPVTTKSGASMCRLNVATSRSRKVGDAWEDQTTWYRVTIFGKQADSCMQYLSKGRQVMVSGHIETSSYEKEGQTHYSWELVARDVKFLGGKQSSEPAPYEAPKYDAIPF